jgi:hypothetical protein
VHYRPQVPTFTPETARLASANGRHPSQQARRHVDLRQAVALRDLLFHASKANDVEHGELARLAHAWNEVQERLRILRGRPLPGQLRPEPTKPVRKSRSRLRPDPAVAEEVAQKDITPPSTSVPAA